MKFIILISKFEIWNFICLGFGNVCFEFVNNESASTNLILVQHLFFWFIEWIWWCKYGCFKFQMYIGKCCILGFYGSNSYASHHPPHQWCAYIIKKIDYYFSTIVPSLQNQPGLGTQCHASIPVHLIRHCSSGKGCIQSTISSPNNTTTRTIGLRQSLLTWH